MRLILITIFIRLTIAEIGNETSVSSSIDEVKHLNVMVDILDSQTAKVSWIMADTQRHLLTSLEIIYSPLQASYWTVQPVSSPAVASVMLENLMMYTDYQLVVRAKLTLIHNKEMVMEAWTLSSDTIYFSTASAIKFPEDNITGSMTNGEVVMIGFILLLWLYVIRIFLQKWDKISRHIPSQPVYSKEMSEKIEMEEEKLRSANSIDNSFFSANTTALLGEAWYNQGRTNSTVLFKQPNSLEVDRAQLRKTRSAEYMGLVAPTIIIENVSTSATPVITSPSPHFEHHLRTPSPQNGIRFPATNRSRYLKKSQQTGRSLDVQTYTDLFHQASKRSNEQLSTLGPSLSTSSENEAGYYRRMSDNFSTRHQRAMKYRQRLNRSRRFDTSPCMQYQRKIGGPGGASSSTEVAGGVSGARGARLVKQMQLTSSAELESN